MAMKGRRIINFIELWSIAVLRGSEIWVSVISFWESNICWPQQPPTEKYQISVKNWNFDDQFTKRDCYCSFGWQGWSNHQVQQMFWWIDTVEAVEVIEATEVIEAVEVIDTAEVLRPGKSLLKSKESSRFLNSALFWCFEKKIIFVWIMKYHVEF